jgi:hypothetical protein
LYSENQMTTASQEVRAFLAENGRRTAKKLLDGFYADVDARWPDLDTILRDEFAHELLRRHMQELGRRTAGRPRPRRKNLRAARNGGAG